MKKLFGKMTVYEDPSIRVERDKVSGSKWGCVYYTAFITIADASQLRTLPADDTFLSRMTTPATNMAKRVNAVMATNGDYCTAIDTKKATSYILRQGVVYRDSVQTGLDLLMIDEDGDFHILQASDELESMDKTMIDGKKVINAFQFGPGLVIDGEKVPDEYILDYSHSPDFAQPDHKAQRMCIAQIDDLHYMVLCCAFYGLDLCSLRDLAMELAPVKNVYVLDGGESSQFVFMGTKLNNPTLEYCLKDDALGDPMINDTQILAIGAATQEELDKIAAMAYKVNEVLIEFFKTIGIELIDFKIEFGRFHGDIILADEISPDTCRLWDVETHQKLDKDRFRRDMGGVEEAYAEVFKRLNLK